MGTRDFLPSKQIAAAMNLARMVFHWSVTRSLQRDEGGRGLGQPSQTPLVGATSTCCQRSTIAHTHALDNFKNTRATCES